MKPQEAYEWLFNHGRKTEYLDSISGLLGWDLRTVIPPKGHPHRTDQLSTLTELVHTRRTDPKIDEMLAVTEALEMMRDPLLTEAVNVRGWRRDFNRAAKIPQRLAVELSRATSEGETAWEAARPRSDWKTFRPYLERIVALKLEEADILKIGEEPYDALLDEFEPGATAKSLEPIFRQLREAIRGLLDRIDASSRRPDASILKRAYPRTIQEAFAREAAERIGYDFSAGRLDPSAHPFTVGIGPGDVRITTRYNESTFAESLFGVIHETGHALYDQGLQAEHWGTPMGQTVSLGIHESQSRMWENMVGRSLGFWKYFYPKAKERFTALDGVALEALHFAVNDVHRSLIRTEADEVTYNLHVMLRFELELALMRQDLKVSDLPDAWNEKMRAYFDLTPPNHSQGVMQDIHWSGGALGYFPTYTLGNLYSAQLFNRARKDLGENLDELFAHGEFAPLLGWLRTKIHEQGRRYMPRDLVREATGEELNPKYLIDYLYGKFGALYGF